MKMGEENGLNLHVDKGWEGSRILEAQIRGRILQSLHFKKEGHERMTRHAQSQRMQPNSGRSIKTNMCSIQTVVTNTKFAVRV